MLSSNDRSDDQMKEALELSIDIDTTHREILHARISLSVIFIVLSLVANFFVPAYCSEEMLGNVAPWLGTFAFGGLLAELAILSYWCGLGPQPLTWRIPCLMVFGFLVILAFVLGLFVASDERSRPPSDGIIVIFTMGLTLLTLTAGCFALVGKFLLGRLQSIFRSSESEGTHQRSAFSIRFLLIITTIVALTIGAIRLLLAISEESVSIEKGRLLAVVLFVIHNAVFCQILMNLFSFIILGGRTEAWVRVLFGVPFGLAILVAHLWSIGLHSVFEASIESYIFLILFFLGFSFFFAVFLAFIRLVGYRLR